MIAVSDFVIYLIEFVLSVLFWRSHKSRSLIKVFTCYHDTRIPRFSTNQNMLLNKVISVAGRRCCTKLLNCKPWQLQLTAFSRAMTNQAIVKCAAPEWSANAVVDGKTISELNSKKASGNQKRWTVLVFYPLDFTFVCPTELIAFNDRQEEFSKLNANVVGVSVDSEFSHLKWIQTPRAEGGLAPFSMPLVADLNKKMSQSFGVLHDDSVALRGLFIIDPKNILRHVTINDLPIGRDVDETLRVLQALQFTDEHGEVCPANWRPGKRTMVADPVKSMDYFKNQ